MSAGASRPIRGSGQQPASRPVVVLVCGEPERGDDAAAIRAVALLDPAIGAGADVRLCGALEVEDLLAIEPGAACLLVDAATGIGPGTLASGPLDALVTGSRRGAEGAPEAVADRSGRMPAVRPRSTHAMPVGDVLGLAAILRPGLPDGRFVAIGGASFALGGGLSPAVAAALPGAARLVAAEVRALAGTAAGAGEAPGTIGPAAGGEPTGSAAVGRRRDARMAR